MTTTSCGSIAVSGCAASRSASCERHEGRERLAGLGLLDHGGMHPLELVDQARPATAVGHPSEQLGHLPVDGLLRRAERGRDLLVAESLGHHVEQLTVALGGASAIRRAARRSRDRPCSRLREPRGSHVRARRPARSGPSGGSRARCDRGPAARSRTPRRRARTGRPRRCRDGPSRIECAQSIPSSWKVGGILMSVTTTSGTCSAAAISSDGASSATPTTSMSS